METNDIQQTYLNISKDLRTDQKLTVQNIFDLFYHLSALYSTQGIITSSILKMVASLAGQQAQPTYTIISTHPTSQIVQTREKSQKTKHEEGPKPTQKKTSIPKRQINDSPLKVKKAKLDPIQIDDDGEPLSMASLQLFIDDSPVSRSPNLLMNLFTTPIVAEDSIALPSSNPLLNIFTTPVAEGRSHQHPIDFYHEEKKASDREPQVRIFKGTVRQKQGRRMLAGHFCQDCKDFTDGLKLNTQEQEEWCQKCSRHRGNNNVMHQDTSLFPTPDH